MKILLAEDDKNLGRLLQNLLKKENIKTDWVEDGEAAYEQCYRCLLYTSPSPRD